MRFALLLFIFLPFCFNGFPQKTFKNYALVAKKKSNGLNYAVSSKGKVTATVIGSEKKYEGGLAIVNDSVFAVGGKLLPLKYLKSIKVSKLAPKLIGGISMGLGATGLIIGAFIKNFANNFPASSLTYQIYNGTASAFLAIGGVFGAGGIIIATHKKRFTAEKYKFEILSYK